MSSTTCFLCQAVLWFLIQWPTVGGCQHNSFTGISACLIPWLKGSEWHCFISLPGSLISHVSFYDQQQVSDTALFPGQATSHQSCLIPWPTGSEYTALFPCQAVWSVMFHPMTNSKWVTLLYLPSSLINHVSSHDQQQVSDTTLFPCQVVTSIMSHPMSIEQAVSDTALFPCQAVSSIMPHPMTNRKWVTLLYFLARQSHKSCLIPWPTGSEWHCFIPLPSSLIDHVSSMTNTVCEWYCFIPLPGSLINHVSLIPWSTGCE